MGVLRIIGRATNRIGNVWGSFVAFGKEEDRAYMSKIKPEHKCQVYGCWEDVRWLYLKGGVKNEHQEYALPPFFSKQDLSGLKKYFLRPLQQIKLDRHRERDDQRLIFRTCHDHRDENSVYTRSKLEELGWSDEHQAAGEKLFPLWLAIMLSAYALALAASIFNESLTFIPPP